MTGRSCPVDRQEANMNKPIIKTAINRKLANRDLASIKLTDTQRIVLSALRNAMMATRRPNDYSMIDWLYGYRP